MYDQTTPISPHVDRPGYHLTEDLADRAIEWIRRQRAGAPDRPWFCYFATPAVHAPHHAPKEWIDRFAGTFDDGWDALRTAIHRTQIDLGVIPPGTVDTARPSEIPAWEDYPERYRPVATRLMECFAGFLAHTDHHIGRVIEEARQLDSADGTETLIIYLTGDNGASAEGTIHGAWSAPSFQNGVPEDPEWLLERISDFGTERCENHFNVGWAWALDAPFKWMKQVASHFGGTRNGMALEWSGRIHDPGAIRSQFHHVVDITPTILDAAGVEPPTRVNGLAQMPIDGISMLYTLDGESPSRRHTQYFEILGNRGIYHDGLMASCFHGRVPWIRMQAFEFDGPQERWELYDITSDFSQSIDLADERPEALERLRRLFDEEARRHGVYPLRDAGSRRGGDRSVPDPLSGRTSMTYTTAHVRMPESSVINLKNCSWRISTEIDLDERGDGVIVCQGGNMAGWSLWLDARRPRFTYNCFGHVITSVGSVEHLAPGHHRIDVTFAYDGGFGRGGELLMVIDGSAVDGARLERTVPLVFSMSGETFDVGTDTGSHVTDYPGGSACTAGIRFVELRRLDEPDPETRRLVAEGMFRAGLSTQ